MGLAEVLEVAEDLIALLSPPSAEPLPGYGHAMLWLANVLNPRQAPRH